MTEIPLFVTKRANLSIFQPSGDTVEMEGMITLTPSQNAILGSILIGLALDARVHCVVSANGTVISRDVP